MRIKRFFAIMLMVLLVISCIANTSMAASYTVEKGDSLWSIAADYLGSGLRWNDIYELNRDKIHNPNLIFVGQEIVLPDAEETVEDSWATAVVVLMYHNIVDMEEMPDFWLDENGNINNNAVLSTQQFERQMDILEERGYSTLRYDEFVAFVKGEKDVPEKSVLITFDDGWKNNYINAYPILKEKGYTAICSLITSRIEKQTKEYNPNKQQFLSWEEIANSKDVFEYCSHTNAFHTKDENGVAFLIAKQKDEIREDLSTSLSFVDYAGLAYPFGSYDEEVVEIMQELGIEVGFTTRPGVVLKGGLLYDVKRNSVRPTYDDEKFIQIIEQGLTQR